MQDGDLTKNVLTACKAVTLLGGQQIIAVIFLSQSEIHFRGEKQTSRENNSIIEKNNVICLLVFLACRLCP